MGSLPLSLSRFTAPCLLSLAVLLGAASPDSLSAQGGGVDNPSCAACTDPSTCARVGRSGSTGCSIKAGQACTEELGFCIIVSSMAMRDLGIDRSRVLRVQMEGGGVDLMPVGGGRYAAWSCSGELLHVAQRTRDGRMVRLAVEPLRDRYRYRRLVARRSAPRAA